MFWTDRDLNKTSGWRKFANYQFLPLYYYKGPRCHQSLAHGCCYHSRDLTSRGLIILAAESIRGSACPSCFCLAGSSVRLPIYLIYNCSTKLDQLSYLIDPENSPEQCLNLSLRTSWNILTWAGVVVVCSGLWSLLQTTWNPSHSSMFCEGYLNRIRIILGPFHTGWSLLSPSLERSISLGLFL